MDEQLFGEWFTATTGNFKVVQEFIPKPYSWERFQDDLDTWFFLCQYEDMDLNLPGPDVFTLQLAALHRVGTSENGTYRFPVTTCDDAIPHNVEWQEDWGPFYGIVLRAVAEFDAQENGHWEELNAVLERAINHVIPRLFRVLNISPSLVYGDMYEGKVGTDSESGKVMILVASSIYANSEI
jgi:protein-ribulosamine 3-kinase